MIRSLFLLFGLFLTTEALTQTAVKVDEQRILEEAPTGNNWFLNGGSFRGEHFSPLEEVNAGNVHLLGLDWSIDLPAPNGIAATPIAIDGVIYLSGPQSVVFAINAADGRTIWTFRPKADPKNGNNWYSRVNRGVAVWEDRVLITVSDCRLIGLDRNTGKQSWSQTTCNPELGYGITDAPRVGGGMVFVGNAGSESHRKNRGYISAYEISSGKFLWRFHTVPSDKPEENRSEAMKMAARTWSGDALQKYGGGGSNWNEMTYDPDSGLLFFGTAGALPYVYEYRSPEGGDNLFTSSVVAVNARTGKYAWHYQTVPEDSWEYNATMNIVLADLPIEGRQRQALMIAPKNGFFYVLDRMSGELLSARNFVKINWASHIDLESGRPVLSPEGKFWQSPPGTRVNVWPNMWGAHSTSPMAFHPGTGLAYIPAVNVPSVVTYHGDGEYSDTLEMFEEVDGKPHIPGMLIAWDPVTQRERWSVNHTVAFNGGVLATAGNIVFQGDATGLFSAYDAETGSRLWSASTGTAISAAPVSYISGGQQRILIPVGAGSGMQFAYPSFHAGKKTSGKTRLMSFSLENDLPLPDSNRIPLQLPELAPLYATAGEVEKGRQLFNDHGCGGCHGKAAVARFGGTVPDLRYADLTADQNWQDVVIRGDRADRGMPAQEISIEDAEAIRLYILSRAHELARGKP